MVNGRYEVRPRTRGRTSSMVYVVRHKVYMKKKQTKYFTNNESRITNNDIHDTHDNHGFTLIEVLVALAICSLFLTGVLSLQLTTTKLLAQTQREFLCLPVAVEQIEELTGKNFTGEEKKDLGKITIESKNQTVSIKDYLADRISVKVFYEGEEEIELDWYDIR